MMSLTQSIATRCMAVLSLGVILSGCGGNSAQVEQTPLPPPVEQGPKVYSGPPASTDDVQRFKLSLWDNISGPKRCGACHDQTGQAPQFARSDDINLAYTAANPLVNLSDPASSLLVQKVSGGHNCWLSSDQACGDIMTTWIANWADTEANANQIQLEAPIQKSPGASKNFPASSALFEDTVYPLLTRYCADCHTNSASIPISPYFASSDADEAYQAAKSRINLDNPAASRLVERIRDEFHNCWSDCASDSDQLIASILSMSDGIDVTEIDAKLVNSKALTLFDGTLATGGGRYDGDIIAKWEFKTGSGVTAFDTSGVEPAINLTLSGDLDWIGGWGLQLRDGKAQGSTSSSKKIHDLITATAQMSIETWLVPANVTQEGPARIVSYSGGATSRNFTLGQTLYNYDYLLRTSNSNGNGIPSISTPDADEVLQASLQHVVVTFDPVSGKQIFVNGEHIDISDDSTAGEVGNLNEWNDTYAFVLGSEVSGDEPWAGSIRFVAIHNRALTEQQVKQNFAVGIGQKFFLLFNVSEHIDIPQSYVVLEVSQFDSYSYLFAEPLFISLDENALISELPIRGLRIGINGREIATGQVYQNLDTHLSSSNYVVGQGQALSRLGTTVAIEKGPETDEFFLTFETLGAASNVVVEAEPPAAAEPIDLIPQATVGVRNFAEINASMSAVTGVPTSNAAVKAAFESLKQQLPTLTNLDGFVAANQMAITQMAIKYCDQLVESDSLRDNYFVDFDFTQAANQGFSEQQRDAVISPLLDNVIGRNINSQPQRESVTSELNKLIDRLTNCSSKSCDAQYTRTIVKATCAASVGSAALLIQ